MGNLETMHKDMKQAERETNLFVENQAYYDTLDFNQRVKNDLSGELDMNFLDDLETLEIL